MKRWILFAFGLALLLARPAVAGKSLDELRKELRHFDYKTRMAAVDSLEEMGGMKAAEAIRSVLDDEDWGVQIRALQALGRMKVPELGESVARKVVEGEIHLVRAAATKALWDMALPDPLERLLKGVRRSRDDEQKVRALGAAEILAEPDDLEAIAGFASARDDEIRAAAFRAMGFTKNPEAEKYALKGIRDKAIAVRVAAAEALGRIGSPEAIDRLVDFVLQEPDPYILTRVSRWLRALPGSGTSKQVVGRALAARRPERRARIVRLLAAAGIPESGEALRGLLDDGFAEVRAWAARGVGTTGFRDAIPDLTRVLFEDPDPTVRRVALDALVPLIEDRGDRLALLARAAVEGNREIKVRACVAIRREGGVGVIENLYPLVADPDWRVATGAMITIGTLGHYDQIEVLQSRLGDRDWRIRAAAYESLGQLRHMDVVPILINGLADPDPVAASAALKNLQILAQKSKGPDREWWKDWYEKNKDVLEITKKGYREEIPDDVYGKSKYLIEILKTAQIVCVLGKYDHVEWVLEHLGIRATVIRPQEIDTIGLNPKQLVLINCEGSIGRKDSIERLQWFVHVGGYLMTTDWALQNAVVRAFPGYIDRDQKAKTGNDVVKIEAAAPDHPLLRGVFDKTPMLMWWLEVIAFPMKVVDPFRTEILVDSLEMLTKHYGSSTMATVFEYGHGKVEHCISHFYLQEEGLTNRTTAKDRKIFAADNLGISLDQIRMLDAKKFFEASATEAMTKEIAEDYSMFKLIVNFVVEKRRQVEQE